MHPEGSVGECALHESGDDAGHDRPEDVPSHRVVDDENDVGVEEGQRIREKAVEQGVKGQRDEQADRITEPSQGAYLTTSAGILRVWITITSSMLPKSTAGLIAISLKRCCPFSALTTVPTG